MSKKLSVLAVDRLIIFLPTALKSIIMRDQEAIGFSNVSTAASKATLHRTVQKNKHVTAKAINLTILIRIDLIAIQATTIINKAKKKSHALNVGMSGDINKTQHVNYI